MQYSTCSTFGDIQAPTATESDHLCTVSGASNSTESIYNIPEYIDPCELMNTLKPKSLITTNQQARLVCVQDFLHPSKFYKWTANICSQLLQLTQSIGSGAVMGMVRVH